MTVAGNVKTIIVIDVRREYFYVQVIFELISIRIRLKAVAQILAYMYPGSHIPLCNRNEKY